MANVLPREKQIAVINALVEGCSIRSTERMTGVNRETVGTLLVRVGNACADLLDSRMQNLACKRLEIDELWAFVGKKQSDYSRLVVTISLARTKRWSFIKLVAGVYVAFAISALSFLLGPYDGGRRTGLLGGTLFAVLVNQRVAESFLGRVEQLTLVDIIHLVAMIYIFAIAIAGIYAQRLFNDGQEAPARRSDRIGLYVTSITYVIVNLGLLAAAAIRG